MIHHDAFYISRSPEENEPLGYNTPSGLWVHIAVVYDGTHQYVYIDGVLDSSRDWPGRINLSESPVLIGSGHFSDDQYWGGLIDEVRIWNIARTQEQVQATMNTRPTENEEGLVGYWSFDEGEGQVAGDASGNGNDGQLGDSSRSDEADPIWVASDAPIGPAPVPIEPPEGMVSWWPGDGNAQDIMDGNHGILSGDAAEAQAVVDQGFSLDGTGDFVLVSGDRPNLNITGDVTVDLWAKRTVFGRTSVLIDKGANLVGSADRPDAYSMWFSQSDHLVAGFARADGSLVFLVGPVVTDSRFHHYAYVRSGNTHSLLVDGVVVTADTFTGVPGDTSGLPLAIGAVRRDPNPPGFAFEFGGVIDEVEIFSRALSDAEINAIYDAGSAGKRKLTPTPAPLGVWATKAPVPVASNGPSVRAINGLIYAVAGWNRNQGNALAVYNPATDTWTTKAPRPSIGSDKSHGVIKGILYEAGGTDCCVVVNSVFAYNPATDTWSTRAPMPTKRSRAASGVIAGKLYVAGGHDFSGSSLILLANLEAYDPVSNSWTTLAAMPTARSAAGGGVVNGLLYVIGGAIGSSAAVPVGTVEAYDPTTNTWSTKAPMPTPRHMVGVAVVGNILYAIGGHGADSGNLVTTVEAYDPISNTWSTKAGMPTPRAHFGATEADGTIYAIGGDAAAAVINANEAFTP